MHHSKLLGAALCTLSLFTACQGAEPAATSQAIIGGTTTGDDPGVMAIYAHAQGSPNGGLCTGQLLSPHVILTAAHCVDPRVLGPALGTTNIVFEVYFGADFNSAPASSRVAVANTFYDPAFSSKSLYSGHDVGIVILQDAAPASIPFVKINRSPLAANNQDIRLVGYGESTNNGTGAGAGLKRRTQSKLASVTNVLAHTFAVGKQTCHGDSGGPAFMNVNGVDVSIGMDSFGTGNCDEGEYFTRVDQYLDFIDSYVAQYDPKPNTLPGGSDAGSTSPDGGSNGGGGGGGVPNGGACQRDSECESGLCGLGSNGAPVCMALPSTYGALNGGCSVMHDGTQYANYGAGMLTLAIAAIARGLRRRFART